MVRGSVGLLFNESSLEYEMRRAWWFKGRRTDADDDPWMEHLAVTIQEARLYSRC